MAVEDALVAPGVIGGAGPAFRVDEDEAAHLAAGQQAVAVGGGVEQFENQLPGAGRDVFDVDLEPAGPRGGWRREGARNNLLNLPRFHIQDGGFDGGGADVE